MLKICLTVISILALTSCAKTEFPADYLYQVDVINKVCDQFKIDKEKMQFQFEKAIPFDQCPVVFGFEQKDVGNVMNFLRRMAKKAEKCQ